MVRTSLLDDLMNLHSSIDNLFGQTGVGESFGTLASRARSGYGAIALPIPRDVYATEDRVVMMAAVPGMTPDDLDLTVHQNTVTLSGSLPNAVDAEEAKGATWYVHELPSGSFRRSITLPFAVDVDKANASFDQGILHLTLPKAEAAKPKRISIASGQREAISAESGDQS